MLDMGHQAAFIVSSVLRAATGSRLPYSTSMP